jgi:hypothetical protein
MKPVTRQADSQLFRQSSDRQKFSYTYNYQKGRESVNQTIIRKIESPFVRRSSDIQKVRYSNNFKTGIETLSQISIRQAESVIPPSG